MVIGNFKVGVFIKKIDFFILCLQGFCIAFNVGSISAIVPAIAKDFGVSEFVVGRINWAYMLPYGFLALLYGPLTRRFDNKHIAVASLVLFSCFNFLSALAPNHVALFVFRFLVGIFAAATTPLVLIYIADRAHEARRGKAIGFFFSATFVADLSGLFLSGLVPWRAMFFIPGVFGLVVAGLTAWHFPHTLAGKTDTRSRYLEAFREPAILKAFVYIFFVSMLYQGVRQWLGVYFSLHLKMSQLFISMTLAATSLAGIFGEAFGGLHADKKGRVPTLKAGIFLMSLAALLLIFVKSALGVVLLMLALGFGWTVNHAGLSTFLTDLDKRFMKEISSLNSSVRFVAGGLGVVVAGWLMQKSFTLGFFVYGSLFLLMFLGTEKILLKRV